MRYLADLHIHSHFSRATSPELNLEHLHQWAQIKGLSVVATGDITHPKWLEEMRCKLVEDGSGLLRLPEFQFGEPHVPTSCRADVQFILSGEISTIYKKGDKVRKVHSVVFLPTLEAVSAFQKKLERIGNISSDGRPILGLDTRDLLEILLDTDPNAHLIPAHIWTPWFSIFGSKSGFDSIEECFGDLTPHIFALETGLSSDPAMNWRLSMLDRYALVSNSDAHSPAKLAREANIFHSDMSYTALFDALRQKDGEAFGGTIEFFPEEGKYHADGHRKCNLRMTPEETKAHNGLCPVCGAPAVLGVSYRVAQLADRPHGFRPPQAKPFHSLIPLPEVLSEVFQAGASSKRVEQSYRHLLNALGPELFILLDAPLSDIQAAAGDLTAEAIRRMREGRVFPQPGYDGEYGIIRIFLKDEREQIARQSLLFDVPAESKVDLPAGVTKAPAPQHVAVNEAAAAYGANDEQERAIAHRGAPLIIHAGPGSGKTYTLVKRLATLIETGDAHPEKVLAITFTNRAAEEMRERLHKLLGDQAARATISTFHAFGVSVLREQERFWGRDKQFIIADPRDRDFRAQLNAAGIASQSTLGRIALCKSRGYTPDALPKEVIEAEPEGFAELFRRYEQTLVQLNAVDFEDLIILPLRLLSLHPELRRDYFVRYPVIAVDEFQDLNRMQYELFRLLAISARDVCVIGDPDQAIYGFRGADRRYFAQFQEDFPHTVAVHLTRNYRSTKNILNASQQMLHQMEKIDERRIWSPILTDVKILLHESPSERAEAEFVVQKIEALVGGTGFFSYDSERVASPENARYAFSDFAILLRSRRLAPPLIEALTRSGIPYSYADDDLLIDEPLMQLFLASWHAQSTGASELMNVALDYFQTVETARLFAEAVIALSDDAGLKGLINLFKSLMPKSDLDNSNRIFLRLEHWASFFEKEPQRFFDALLLQRRIDTYDERADRVRLLTLHASKGLEFAAVFIVGCEEGVVPHFAAGQKTDVDEERRLLYVGMTRAQRHLFLSRSKSRLINGQKQTQAPSRFLGAISESLLQQEKSASAAKKRPQQMGLF